MQQTVYIDVLICVNLFINYFILLATAKFMNFKLSRKKIILASLLGSIYSLYILLPDINFFISLFIKLMMSLSIIVVAFFGLNRVGILKATICFYFMNFSFCGVILFFWYFFSIKGTVLHNGIIYFNISPMIFFLITVLSYLIVRVINRFLGNKRQKDLFYNIEIHLSGKKSKVWAKVDTGNTLKEPFSKLPVIIVEFDDIKDILPKEDVDLFKNFNPSFMDQQNIRFKSYRIIPFNVIGGSNVLLGFKPDKLFIINGEKRLIKDAYIGVVGEKQFGGNFSALINPEILENETAEVWR